MEKVNLFFTPRTKLVHEHTAACDFDTAEFNAAVMARRARTAQHKAREKARRTAEIENAREGAFFTGAAVGAIVLAAAAALCCGVGSLIAYVLGVIV